MDIREYLKKYKILCDGAFGTYYAMLCGDDLVPEKSNVNNPEIVRMIHKSYIAAGANLIRTNTFSSNTAILECNEKQLIENIKSGYYLAEEAVDESNNEVFIAADIGPINIPGASDGEICAQYKLICDTFIKCGAKIILFETFDKFLHIEKVIKEIKKENKDIFIMVSFCVNQYGYTNAGVSAKNIIEKAKAINEIDSIGFNCGVGPGHIYKILQELNLNIDKYISVLPNASYPKIIQNRMVFLDNMDYFAQKLNDISKLGVDMIGGCCGTNPDYMKKAYAIISKKQDDKKFIEQSYSDNEKEKKINNSFYYGKENKKLIAVELAPPPDSNYEKIMDCANVLKESNVDVITFPDSPSGRTRTDSILMAVKVLNEVGITVMPHICCRDKNAIAIRSQLLGAHINGVKNFLIITGDPVPTMIRQEVKSVFNFNSALLMNMVKEMNKEQFTNDPMCYGGAINHNRYNIEVEINRIKKKIENGATFFLTQPVFTDEEIERLKYIKSKVDTKILCGVMPLVSYRNALFIKNEMAGINVTEDIVNRFNQDMTKEQGEAIGVSIVKEIIEKAYDYVDGFYFSVPFNRVYLIKEILDDIKNK